MVLGAIRVPPLSEFQQASIGHIKRLNNLIDKQSIPRLHKLYIESMHDLERKLAKAVGSGASPFTIQKHRTLLTQVHQGLAHLGRNLGTALGKETVQTQEASAMALIRDIKKLEGKARGAPVQLPIEQAARFTGVIDKRKTSLLKMNKTSMAKYGASMVGKLEGALAQTLVQGESGFQAIDRVTKAYDMEWWRAERIVRTEQAWAYNATAMDGVADATKTFPDMMMRWCELVADVTLVPYDDRVGADSVAMHGQLARAGTMFRMPANASSIEIQTRYGKSTVSKSLLGKSWANPPNRPNDRSVIQPWRPGWGWGWEYIGGVKVVR